MFLRLIGKHFHADRIIPLAMAMVFTWKESVFVRRSIVLCQRAIVLGLLENDLTRKAIILGRDPKRFAFNPEQSAYDGDRSRSEGERSVSEGDHFGVRPKTFRFQPGMIRWRWRSFHIASETLSIWGRTIAVRGAALLYCSGIVRS